MRARGRHSYPLFLSPSKDTVGGERLDGVLVDGRPFDKLRVSGETSGPFPLDVGRDFSGAL